MVASPRTSPTALAHGYELGNAAAEPVGRVSTRCGKRLRCLAALSLALASFTGSDQAHAENAALLSADIPLIGYGLIRGSPADYGYDGMRGIILPTGLGAEVTLGRWRHFEIGLRGDYLTIWSTTDGPFETQYVHLVRAELVFGPVAQLGGETEMPLMFGLGYTGVWAVGRSQSSDDPPEYSGDGLGLTFRPKVRHWLSERFAVWGAAEAGVAGPEGTSYGGSGSYHQTIVVTALLRAGVTYDAL